MKEKTIITDDMILGYRDYTIDRKTKKDFPTLDSVVDWIDDLLDHTSEVTKEFCDFAEQEYGINALIERMKELHPKFPYDYTDDSPEDAINFVFANRNKQMHASDFKEAKIPQEKGNKE